jgi:hypothetical protein
MGSGGRGQTVRRVGLAGAVLVACGLWMLQGLAQPAWGSMTWSGPIAVDLGGGGLNAVSCPSTGQCTAVDDNSQEVTFAPSSAPGPIAARVSSVTEGEDVLAVSCPSTSQCTSVDTGDEASTFDPEAPGSLGPRYLDHGPTVTAIACPSTSQCAAVETGGDELTFDPASPETATKATVDPAGQELEGLSCPSAGQCTSVSFAIGDAVTFDPSSPGGAISFSIDGLFELTGVSCPSPSQCTAVDDQGNELTFDPTSPGSARTARIDLGSGFGGNLQDVACPSVSQCTAVDDEGRVVSFDPGDPSGATTLSIDGGVELTAVTCPSTALCVAVDEDGNMLVGRGESKEAVVPVASSCATTAVPGEPSPHPGSVLPTALTPRFGRPGSRTIVTPGPTGTQFCPEEQVDLGGAIVNGLEESTPLKRAFRVPPEADGGLGLVTPAGLAAPLGPFEVDNFRFPWGFSLTNRASNGAGGSYDSRIPITAQDLNSVFSGLGPPGSPVYREAEYDARSVLQGGLCYGFSLLSLALYGDLHGQQIPLGFTGSPGYSLGAGAVPYFQQESAGGAHGLTHALMRAAVSQFSPRARAARVRVTSASVLEGQLASAFAREQPAMLLIFFKLGASSEGHAILAFDEQTPDPSTGQGLAVDVVDPNAPWSSSRPPGDYRSLQVHVRPDGSWSFTGTFGATTFGNPIGGPSGSLYVMTAPPAPGGLKLQSSAAAGTGTVIEPGKGESVSAIGYSGNAGHGIPADVQPDPLFYDAPDERLLVPASRHAFTATFDSSPGAGGESRITGAGFLDAVHLLGSSRTVTVDSTSGQLSLPEASTGTSLSITRVSATGQRTMEVDFSGRVKRPTLDVTSAGGATLTTAGGAGRATITLIASSGAKTLVRSRPQTVPLHGRAHIHRQTPAPGHRAHKRHKSHKH